MNRIEPSIRLPGRYLFLYIICDNRIGLRIRFVGCVVAVGVIDTLVCLFFSWQLAKAIVVNYQFALDCNQRDIDASFHESSIWCKALLQKFTFERDLHDLTSCTRRLSVNICSVENKNKLLCLRWVEAYNVCSCFGVISEKLNGKNVNILNMIG